MEDVIQLKDFHDIPEEELLSLLHSSREHGLSSDEALRRLRIFGPNELAEEEKVPWWKFF